MFTGLIQALGQVERVDRQSRSAQLTINSRMAADNLELGESIAVNGACLTVIRWDERSFVVDVSPETLACTTLGRLGNRQTVNLERALRLGDRLGGHLVSGHIDCVATLVRRTTDQNAVRMEFKTPPEALRYLVAKGSVAIDGISLTVNTVSADSFTVAVIPHSLEMTTLKDIQPGAQVNIETDLIGRYVERLFPGAEPVSEKSRLNRDFLAKNGFV